MVPQLHSCRFIETLLSLPHHKHDNISVFEILKSYLNHLMASIRLRASSVLQKQVIKLEKPSVKGKTLAPVLSLSSRMALIEQRLTSLEQDNEWWIDWKKDQHDKLVEDEKRTLVRDENDSIEKDLVESLEGSLKL